MILIKKEIKMKNRGLNREICPVVMLISISLLIVAIFCVVSDEFVYAVRNIEYYAEQYEYCKISASGSSYYYVDYANFAVSWKQMYNDALKCIVLHVVASIVLSIGGGVGLYYSVIGLKKSKENVLTTNNEGVEE